MNTFEIAIVVFGVIWAIVAIINIPLTIWAEKLRAKNQSENNACIFALHQELERYNDFNSKED